MSLIAASTDRRYHAALIERAEAIAASSTDLSVRLRIAADVLWELLGDSKPTADKSTVSWIGFYELAGEGNGHGAEPGAALSLGPCRDKPACSPIAMHGACGQSLKRETTLIVHDIERLGEGYVACDPRDRSELVIPMFDPADASRCWGVLDADSFAIGAFSEPDADAIERFCVSAALTHPSRHPAPRQAV